MLTCVDFSTVDDIHCVHKAVEILESKVEMLVEQFAPLKIQRAFKPEKQPLFEVSSTSKLSHLKTDAFQKFIDTGLDKTSIQLPGMIIAGFITKLHMLSEMPKRGL